MKIKRILLSRRKENNQNAEIQREIDKALRKCIACEYNSKNMESISHINRFLKFLSDTLSQINGRKDEDIYGNCTQCASCSVYYKTREIEYESCPKGKWEKYENNFE